MALYPAGGSVITFIVYSSQYIFEMCTHSIHGWQPLWIYVLTLYQSWSCWFNAKQILFPVSVFSWLILISLNHILLSSAIFYSQLSVGASDEAPVVIWKTSLVIIHYFRYFAPVNFLIIVIDIIVIEIMVIEFCNVIQILIIEFLILLTL